jgi:hypothetical protein
MTTPANESGIPPHLDRSKTDDLTCANGPASQSRWPDRCRYFRVASIVGYTSGHAREVPLDFPLKSQKTPRAKNKAQNTQPSW